MFSPTLLLLPFITFAIASTDLSKPCLDGLCTYHDTHSGAMVTITGTPGSVSDITEASGWVITSCDPTATTQTIRAICETDDSENNCSHLFTDGAKGTVVRLPQHCSAAAFAVVTSAVVAKDQQIPQEFSKRVQGEKATIYDLQVTTQFHEVEALESKPVGFTISSLDSNANLAKRRILNPSHEFGPIPFDQSTNLYHQDFQCDAKNVHGVDVQLGLAGQAKISVGVFVNGSIIPPQIHELYGIIGLNGAMKAKLDVEIAADVQFQDTGLRNLVNMTLLPIHAAGLLSINPQITIDASGAADASGVIRINTVTDIIADNIHFYIGGDKTTDKHGLKIGDPQVSLGSVSDGAMTGFVDSRVVIKGDLSVAFAGAHKHIPAVLADTLIRTIVDVKHKGGLDGSHKSVPPPAPTVAARSIAGRLIARDPSENSVSTTLDESYCVDVKLQRVQDDHPVGDWTDMFHTCVDVESNLNRPGPNGIRLGGGKDTQPKLNPLCDVPLRVVTFPQGDHSW